MHRKTKLLIPILLLLISTLACSVQLADPTATPVPTATTAPSATQTPVTPTDTPTIQATATPTSTLTDTPTITPSATSTAIPCNRAEYVTDVTYPDGTTVLAGASFTKTWRLMNTGSCTWTSGYRLVFSSGDPMGAQTATKFTNNAIPPGSTVDVSIDLTAPGSPGTYRGNFKLRDSDGVSFGINASGNDAFWVEIKSVKVTLPIITKPVFVITPVLKITLKVPLITFSP
jgi:hypothetical protein